jgi:hypothetical protein
VDFSKEKEELKFTNIAKDNIGDEMKEHGEKVTGTN